MRTERVLPPGVDKTRHLLATLNSGQRDSERLESLSEPSGSKKVWNRRPANFPSDFRLDPYRMLFEADVDPLVQLAKLRRMSPTQREAYFQGLIKAIVSNIDSEKALIAVKLLRDEWESSFPEKSFTELVQAI